MNRSAPLQFIDGQYEFTIYDIPGSGAAQFPGDPSPTGQPFRARVVCSDGIVGETALAFPEFGSEVVYVGDIFWRPATPIPVGLGVAPDKTKLTTGDSVLLRTVGVSVGGQTADLTGRAKGTLYTSSNPLIAPVTQEGMATVVAAFTPGSAARVVMTAQNEGVAGSVQLQLGPLGQLQGQVLKADGITPVAGAHVTVIRNQPRENLGTVVTDSGGRFEMLNVSAGSFSISVIDPATGDLGRGFGRLENQGETGQLTVRLNGQGTVNVAVVNAAYQPVRNATVSFTSLTGFRDLRTLTTDANGRVSIERAMAGPFTVSTKDRASNLVAAEAGTLLPGGVVDLVVKLQPVGAIQGRVLAVDGATVQSGVQVRIVSSARGIITQSVTGEDGQFRFDELPLSYGPYTLDAMVNGRLKARVPFLNLTAPGQERVQDIVFGPTAQIRGVVTNLATGQPAARAVVSVQSLNGERYTFSTRTDDNGNYVIDGIAVGRYALTAIAGGLSAAAGGTFSQDGEIQQVNMQLASNGIVGTVFGRDNATPVGAGVTVTLGTETQDQLQTTQTNAQGQYAFTLTNPDTYKVTATGTAYDRGMTSVVITSIVAGEPRTVNVSFLAQGIVQGTVRNPGGGVVGGITVKLTSTSILGKTTYEATTDSQGKYRIAGVYVGQFSVFAQEASTKLAGTSSGMVTVEGLVVPADINLDATGVVHGTVYKPDGVTPLPGAAVKLALGSKNVVIETVSDASGAYRFDAAPIGAIELLATESSSGDIAKGSTRLVTQGEERVVNLRLLGYGKANVTVIRESQLSPAGLELTLDAQTIYGNSSYRARVGTDGVARFAFIPNGTYVLSGDVGLGINRESGSVEGVMRNGEMQNIALALKKQFVGSVYGVVTKGMQAQPQADLEVKLTQGGRILQKATTDAQGNYRFNNVEVGLQQRVEAWLNNKLRAVASVNLATAGEDAQRNLALMGAGTVTVLVVNKASDPQKDITVALVNADPTYGGRRTAVTDALGRAIFTEVVAGRFDIDAYNNEGTLRGEDRGEVRFEGDNPTYTLTLVDSYIPMPVTLYDANGMDFDLQGDGSIARGKSDVFVGNNAADVRASRLDLVVGGVAVPFLNGDGSLGKRAQSGQLIEVDEIHQASGLHVSRRTYIPQTGYFARHLEVLENRTTAPITVGVRVSSHFAQGTVGSRVVDSTSNDSVLDVSALASADRWLVLDDEVDADPFEQDSPPAVAMVFDGENARDKAEQGSVTALGTNVKVAIQWQDVTIQPGETVAYLHFVTQQTGRIPARDSAKRLERLPPEALVGLTEQEISAIRNFAVPAAGLSQLPGLPSVEGTVVKGKVLSGDGFTPVTDAVVTLKSENAYYARTYRTKSGTDGAFAFASGNLGKTAVKAIVQDDFYSYATHPKTESLTTKPLAHFAEGQLILDQDLIFNRSGVLKGKVKRDNGAFLTEGTVAIPYLFPSGKKDLTTKVDAEGAYAFVAINPDDYIITAEVNHPQGKPNVGETSAPVTVMPAATTVADVTIEPVGELIGTLLGPDQNPVVGATVTLDPAPYAPPYRSTQTDTAGLYRFTDVSTGAHVIVVNAAAGSDRANVQISKDTITRQDFALGIRFTRLQVQVKYARGNPAIGASVTAGSKFGVTDGAGVITLDVTAGATIQVTARHPDNDKLTTAQPYAVLNDQPEQSLEMGLPGAGIIKGTLYQSDGVTPVTNASVHVRPDSGSQFAKSVSTSSTGAFQFVGVPLGMSVVTSVDRANYKMALADVALTDDGQEKIIKLVYLDNRVALPYTLHDANAFDYKIEKSAALSFTSGLSMAPALSVNGEPFTGADVGYLDAGARQVTVTQEASLSGLNVFRKIYVPKDAYVSRHLEVFENPTDNPINVSVKLAVSNPRMVVQTSSGDATVSSAQGSSDNWMVLDDGRNEDPFVHVNDVLGDPGFAATAWVVGHAQGHAQQQPTLGYAADSASAEWAQLTVPARSKKTISSVRFIWRRQAAMSMLMGVSEDSWVSTI